MQTIALALKHWPSKITESLLNREAVKKKHCKQPPTPLETASFWTPPPLGISVALQRGGRGEDIFWNYSFYELYMTQQAKYLQLSTSFFFFIFISHVTLSVMTRFTYLLFSKYGKVSWILSLTLSWVILDENSITDLVLRFRMSLKEVCSSLVFIRVTVLEKELHLNLFALAPAPGWVIIQWLAVSSNVEGNVFSLKENNKIRVYIHAVLIDFAS